MSHTKSTLFSFSLTHLLPNFFFLFLFLSWRDNDGGEGGKEVGRGNSRAWDIDKRNSETTLVRFESYLTDGRFRSFVEVRMGWL
jgi:hypothetical protein